MNNTYQKGKLTFVLYPTEEGTFVAACRELALVCEEKDEELVKYRVLVNAKNYLVNVCKNKLGEHLLNQRLPEEIQKEFDMYRKKKANENFQKWSQSIKDIISFKEKQPNSELVTC